MKIKTLLDINKNTYKIFDIRMLNDWLQFIFFKLGNKYEL